MAASSEFDNSFEKQLDHQLAEQDAFVQELNRRYNQHTNEIALRYQHIIKPLRSLIIKLASNLKSANADLMQAQNERNAVSAELSQQKQLVIRLETAAQENAEKFTRLQTEKDLLMKEMRPLLEHKKQATAKWDETRRAFRKFVNESHQVYGRGREAFEKIFDTGIMAENSIAVGEQNIESSNIKAHGVIIETNIETSENAQEESSETKDPVANIEENVERGEKAPDQDKESSTSDDQSAERSPGTKRTRDEFVKKRVKRARKNYRRYSPERSQRTSSPSRSTDRSPLTQSRTSSSSLIKLKQCSEKYQCAECGADIAYRRDMAYATCKVIDDLELDGDECKQIDAIGIFNAVVNVECGSTVKDIPAFSAVEICCQKCETALGWHLREAHEDSQRNLEDTFKIALKNLVFEDS